MLEKIKKNITLFENGAEDYKPEIVLIIGNGAIEGPSWKPVEKLKWFFADNFFQNIPERVNIYKTFSTDSLFLAKLVSMRESSQRCLDKYPNNQAAKDTVQFINGLRTKLGENYQTILNELKIRDLPKNISNWLTKNINKIGIITTNWEPSILRKEWPTIFLHGRIEIPNSILLPTETSYDFENGEHNKCHSNTINWLKMATHLIIWGAAFHEYDAELSNILMSSESVETNLRTLTVINPDPFAQSRAIALAHLQKDPMVLITRDVISSNKELIELK